MRFCQKILFLLTLLVLPFSLQAAQPATPLKLAVLPAADTIVLHLAAERGLFAAEGLSVELIPFQSALEIGTAMRAGALDGHFGDIINVLVQHTSGAPQSIVATTSRSNPGQRHFGLMVSPQSKAQTLDDLRGKDVAASSTTIIDFLLDTLLHKAGKDTVFINPVEIRQIPVRLQMLMSGQLEAALLPEPLVSLLEARGARTLLDDRGLTVPLAVVAVSHQKLAETPDLPERLRRALTAAAEQINANPEAAKALMVEKKLLPKEAAAAYTMLRFDMVHTPVGLPTQEEINAYAAWMRGKNLLRDVEDLNEVARQVSGSGTASTDTAETATGGAAR